MAWTCPTAADLLFGGPVWMPCPSEWREGIMEQTLVYQFFRRKLKIVVLALLMYAALC